ncbi:MAG: hypothetical protein NZ891_02110, partial [bacterium]|nr:hypothetical protein [bacterium]MDW8163521.1 hypothetical protein [Candidatus Omnitrophota bacterium]
FLNKLVENNVIFSEEKSKLEQDNNFIESLKLKNVYILPCFEIILTQTARKEVLKKIYKTVNFVNKNWGKGDIFENLSDLPIEELRKKVRNILAENKGWRCGKALAVELKKEEIPEAYIQIIKKVSKL